MGRFKRTSHAVYFCEYHIVITTRYRRKIINEGIFAHLELKLREVHEHYPHLEFQTVNHDKDHLHIKASIPPTKGVGKMVGVIKQNSSKDLKQKFPFLKQVYCGTDKIWSDGYFVSTVGIDPKVIERYIEQQGENDRGKTSDSLFE